MADREQIVRRFQRVADQRLTAAEVLLKAGLNLEAIYLAGYAVECSLKSVVLKRTPHRSLGEMIRRLTRVGARGHDFDYLRVTLARRPISCPLPTDVVEWLRRVRTWETDLRYEVNRVNDDDAKDFIDAVIGIRDWAKHRN